MKRTAEIGLEVLHRLMAQASKFSKKNSILNTVRRGEMGQGKQKAKQAMLHKGNMEYLSVGEQHTVALGLIGSVSSGKSQVPRN